MEFKDRVANKPNRVKLTYEDGDASVYATVDLADEPIEEGTPLNAINMNKLLNKEDNDYIVEQNTSGIWTYRKWASGIAECWGKSYTFDIAPWDNMSVVCNENLPFEFIAEPIVNCSGGQYQAHSSYVMLTAGTPTNVSAYMRCVNEPVSEYVCWFYFDVKGRWK